MKKLIVLGILAAGVAAVTPARAGGILSIGLPGISVHVGGPPACVEPAVVYAPAPVVYAPAPVYVERPVYVAPPPVVYVSRPAPIYVERRVYVAPPVVVYRPHHYRYVVAPPFCR